MKIDRSLIDDLMVFGGAALRNFMEKAKMSNPQESPHQKSSLQANLDLLGEQLDLAKGEDITKITDLIQTIAAKQDALDKRLDDLESKTRQAKKESL